MTKYVLYNVIFFSLACLSVAIAQVPFKCTGDFYLSQSMGLTQGFNELFTVKVDSITQEIFFDPLPATNEHILNAIGYRVTDNFVYGLDPTNADFYKLDASGTSYFLKTLEGLPEESSYFGADVFPTGDYSVMIGGGEFDHNLVIVNLTNSDYPTEIIPLSLASTGGIPDTRIVDMAFDPLSKILYAIDIRDFRLVTIAINTGIINDTLYNPSDIKANIAAMFFDAFGKLYGYGATLGGGGFGMYSIDLKTGQLKFETNGPSAGGVDGCSCPFNISMQKTVFPQTAFPCSEVLYTIKIANGSQSTHENIILEDMLPGPFEVLGLEYIPYEYEEFEGLGTNEVIINGLRITPGLDSILLRVNVGNSIPGHYGNLAVLRNLPESLGSLRYSDNPNTLRVGPMDSTFIEIKPFTNLWSNSPGICIGDTIDLSLKLPNGTFLWQDGSTDSIFQVTMPGDYAVTATNSCTTILESIFIELQSVDVSFNPAHIPLTLGNSLTLNPNINNTGNQIIFNWNDPTESLNCEDCQFPISFPFEDSEYVLYVENEYGCKDSAVVFIDVEVNRNIFVPNIFSPNNDGINDRFYIQGAGQFEISLFQIYDRWGNIVFDGSHTNTNDPAVGWDGTASGSAVPEGVYVWNVIIRYLDNMQKKFSGSITILR